MIEAFQRWIKRFGSRPWDDELQKAFYAGYRAAVSELTYSSPAKPRGKPSTKRKLRIEPKATAPAKRDPLLERLHRAREMMGTDK